jgi:hypothetical protein
MPWCIHSTEERRARPIAVLVDREDIPVASIVCNFR